jgi:hypothetical protein
MYRSLGLDEVGALLSCNRDYSLVEGFNPDCDLRFAARPRGGDPARFSGKTPGSA